MGTGNTVRKLTDPQSLRGISEDDFKALAKESGLEDKAMKATSATGGGGWIARNPDDSSVTLMWELGDPTSKSSQIVHQGPYIKAQIKDNSEGSVLQLRVTLIRIPGNLPQIENWNLPGGSDLDIPGVSDFP